MADAKAAEREYGVLEAVPREGRHINYIEYMLTWAGASLQPTVWTLGGSLICAGFIGGSMAIILASLASGAVLGLTGYIGYKTGASSAGVYRCTLGIRGSKLVSAAAVINNIGWSAIAYFMAAISLSYIFSKVLGMPAYGEHGSSATMILGSVIMVVLTYLGVTIGGSKTLKRFETIMMIALLVFAGIITAAIVKSLTLSEILAFRVPSGYQMSFPVAFNLMFLVGVTYANVVCDYTRYVKGKAAATTGQVPGCTLAAYWFCMMGMLGCIVAYNNTGVFDMEAANPATLCMELGLGIPLLLVIVFSVVTTSMIDLYSGALALQNVCGKLKFKVSTLIMAIGAFTLSLVPVYITSFFGAFYAFLDILGAIFLPFIVIMIVDFFLRKREYRMDELEKKEGIYWFTEGFNACSIVSWVLGIIIFTLFKSLRVCSGSIGYTMATGIAVAAVYYVIASIGIKRGYYRF